MMIRLYIDDYSKIRIKMNIDIIIIIIYKL